MMQDKLNQIAKTMKAEGKERDEIYRELFRVKGSRLSQIKKALAEID